MNSTRILPALLTGAALVCGLPTTTSTAFAGGGVPPVLNCLTNVCTLLQDDAVDSDGDGFTDADEKLFGSDPNDASSCPPVRWLFARISDETLPGFWLEPQIDLLTISPDGHAITVDIVEAMGSLGLALPQRAGDFSPEAMAPPGVDLGTIGNTLDWQVHGETTAGNPPPPDAPDPSLYGLTGVTPPEIHIELDNGDVWVTNTFSFGEFTSEVHVQNSEGKVLGSGIATSRDPWQAQAEATKKATTGATPEAAAAIADAVEAEAKRLAEEAAKAAAEKAAAEKAAAEKAAAEKAAAEKAAAEKKKGGLADPDAGTPIDPRFLTPEQFEAAIAAGSGSYFTNVGDTGVIALVTASGYQDPTLFIIHINPDADPSIANTIPDIGGQATPDYDPNLPQGGLTGGTLPPKDTNS